MFTSAEKTILSALRYVTTGEKASVSSRPEFIEGAETDWQAVLKIGQQYNLLPILNAALPHDQLSSDISQQLKQASRQQRIRNMVMTQAFVAIQNGFNSAEIRAMPLKGIVLANTVYPSPTLRFFDDIDILIEPDRADDALAILHKLGYRTHPRAEKPDWHHLPPQEHTKTGTTIELHTDLIRRYTKGRWTIAAIWERAQQGSLAGVTCWHLDPIDALVYTALHARHHLFEKATFLLDTVLLTQQVDDVTSLQTRAREAGAVNAIAHILYIAEQFQLADDLPEVSAPRWRQAVARRVRSWSSLELLPATLQAGALPKVVEIMLLDSWGDSLRLARALALPDADFVQAGYGSWWGRFFGRTKMSLKQIGNLIRNE